MKIYLLGIFICVCLCGVYADIDWSFDETTNVIKFNGTGEMEDFMFASRAPWHSLRSVIQGFEMTGNITSIGRNAFSGCDGLVSVTIPLTVKKVGAEAFSECRNLESADIHNTVTSLGFNCFAYCDKLTTLTIPDSVTEWNQGITEGCNNLRHIIVSDNHPSFKSDDGVLYSKEKTTIYAFPCAKDTQFIVPDNVTIVGPACFSGCKNLLSVKLPDSVKRIGQGAFDGCSKLTSVNIPEKVTAIQSYTFARCSALTTIEIPQSVTSISTSAFQECTSLRKVNIPESITEIPQDIFARCSSLTTIVIPQNVTRIGQRAFEHCSNLTSINIPDGVTLIDMRVFLGCSSLSSINIPNNVSIIEQWAFSDCSNLTYITIPDSVTKIGSYSFEGCSSLTSLIIPQTVTTIGQYAFYNCNGLKSINIPDNTTVIEPYTFYGCSSLTSLIIPQTVTTIGQYAFYKCNGLKSINIPNNITVIEPNTFYDCSSLTSIDIPDNVTDIGSYAFCKCPFTSLIIPQSVTTIRNRAFMGCSLLKTVVYKGTDDPNPSGSVFDNVKNLLLCVPIEYKSLTFCGGNACKNSSCSAAYNENVCFQSEFDNTNNEWIPKEREETMQWVNKTNECVSFTCDNSTGNSMSISCGLPDICVDGKCMRESEEGPTGTSVVIEIEGMDFNHCNSTELINTICKHTYLNSNDMPLGITITEEGRVTSIIVYVKDKQCAETIKTKADEVNKETGLCDPGRYGFFCLATKVYIKTNELFISVSDRTKTFSVLVLVLAFITTAIPLTSHKLKQRKLIF